MYEPTLPNQLTVLRMFLIPVLVVAMLSNWKHGDLAAAVIFISASLTDALDGWIARRRSITSNFGKLVDPLADKLLVTAALISLVSVDRLAAWVAMVIIAREFAVTGLRQLAMEQGGPIVAASVWGKLKTIMQVVMVVLLIAIGDPALWVDLVVYATVAVTLLSGADYFFGLRHLLRGDPAEHGDPAKHGDPVKPGDPVQQGDPAEHGDPAAPRRSPAIP